jgi:hypothetical protein
MVGQFGIPPRARGLAGLAAEQSRFCGEVRRRETLGSADIKSTQHRSFCSSHPLRLPSSVHPQPTLPIHTLEPIRSLLPTCYTIFSDSRHVVSSTAPHSRAARATRAAPSSPNRQRADGATQRNFWLHQLPGREGQEVHCQHPRQW